MSGPRLERTLFWTMAVACFTAALACLAARAVDRSAAHAVGDRHGYVIVRVLSPEGAEGLNAAASALGADRRVEEVKIMTAERAAALLQSWSGSDIDSADLPPLRLIEARLTERAAFDSAAPANLSAALRAQGVDAQALAPPPDSAARDARRLQRAALLGALALSAVMALIVLLAARALVHRRADWATVMADLGGTRAAACLPLSDEAGAAGFAAGLLGAAAAGAAALTLAAMALPDLDLPSLRAFVHAADLAPLIAAPFVAAFAAGLGGRWGAEALYQRAARLK